VYNVVGESDGKLIYGISHFGTRNNWKDALTVNIRDFKPEFLNLVVFIDDKEFGRGKLDLLDIAHNKTASFST
jgi:hypothetical protein